MLPEAVSTINGVISKIEGEERQEEFYQSRDLGRLLGPVHEKREQERRTKSIIEFKEREKQRAEEEAQRQTKKE